VEEFAHTLENELDYGLEAAHMEHFAMQFTGESTIYVPKVYREATTGRVLTMEYINGIKISDIARLKKEGLEPREIAQTGFDLILKQIFVHGFFHADPHPGNVFILPGNVICYLDFGMMGRINIETREHFADLIVNIAERDEQKVTDALIRLTIWDDEPDYHSLEKGCLPNS